MKSAGERRPGADGGDLAPRIEALARWSHNLRLDGLQAAPDHYPRTRSARF